MSDSRSLEASPDASVVEEETTPTSFAGDMQSEASFSNIPRVPNNTPAGTVAATIPDNDRLQRSFSNVHMAFSAPASTRDHQDSSSISMSSQETTATEHVPEQSNWAENAEEDVRNALSRLIQLAEDENAVHPEKGVKELYSERLAKLIKEAEIELDYRCSH